MPEEGRCCQKSTLLTWRDLRKTLVTCERHGTRRSGKHEIRAGANDEVSAVIARTRAGAQLKKTYRRGSAVGRPTGENRLRDVAGLGLSKIDRSSPFMHVDCLDGSTTVKNCHPLRATSTPESRDIASPAPTCTTGHPLSYPQELTPARSTQRGQRGAPQHVPRSPRPTQRDSHSARIPRSPDETPPPIHTPGQTHQHHRTDTDATRTSTPASPAQNR